MGFKVSQIAKERKDLFIQVGDIQGEGINVTYSPKAYTVALEDKLEALASRTFQSSSVLILLAGFHPGDEGFKTEADDAGPADEEVDGLVMDWDLVDDDDQKLPIRVTTLKGVPLRFLTDVLEAIQEDAKPSKDAGKASAGG